MTDSPRDAERCPHCDTVMTPISYGFPGPGTFEAAERGAAVLGGCVVFDGQPTSRCTACGTDQLTS